MVGFGGWDHELRFDITAQDPRRFDAPPFSLSARGSVVRHVVRSAKKVIPAILSTPSLWSFYFAVDV